jgi:nucleoid DNA-binding protein
MSRVDPAISKLNLSYKRRISKKRDLKDDAELASLFLQVGINFADYLRRPNGREEAFALVPKLLQGKRPELYSTKGLDFLVQEFDAEVIADQNGRSFLSFPEKPKGDEMNLFAEVAEKCGHKRKIVKEVYDALLSKIRVHLKNDRRIRLPEFAIVKISYRPPRERAKKWNPFKHKKTWVEARPASNKIRISPVKQLKDYVTDKVEVVAPKKKKKKG